MALKTPAIAQFYKMRTVKDKNQKERMLANIGILSSSKNKKSGEYEKDPALFLWVTVRGEKAKAFLSTLREKSLVKVFLSVSTYTVKDENGKNLNKESWNLLVAEPHAKISTEERAKLEAEARKEADEFAGLEVPDEILNEPDDIPF